MIANPTFRSLRAFLTWPALRGVRVGLACALVAWLLSFSALPSGLEDWMLDACFFYRGTRPSHARIVLVGIDEESLAALRKPVAFISPELAEVVAFAWKQGALAVGID